MSAAFTGPWKLRAAVLALVLLGASRPSTLRAENLESVTISAEPRAARLGQERTLEIVVRHLPGARVQWADFDVGSDVGPDVKLYDVKLYDVALEQEQQGALVVERWRATLAVFSPDVGSLVLPPLVLAEAGGAERALAVPTLELGHVSTINREDPRLMPDEEPVALLVTDWRALWALGAAFALCLGAALVLVRRRRQPASVPEAQAPHSPHAEALAALDVIAAELDEGNVKRAFHGMSDVVRVYLGRRFSFDAVDKTSSEIRSRMSGIDGSHEWAPAVQSWLGRCDMVKFAGAPADLGDARHALDVARELIERTKSSALMQRRPREVARA